MRSIASDEKATVNCAKCYWKILLPIAFNSSIRPPESASDAGFPRTTTGMRTSAPCMRQLSIRYLTKDFLRVLNLLGGKKLFAKFSTQRKILC